MNRSWKPLLGLLLAAALFGRAWALDRRVGLRPLSVASASLLERPLDTTVVLSLSGRYHLVHEFVGPAGKTLTTLRAAGPFVEFDGAVAGGRWSTRHSGPVGDYLGGAIMGFVVGEVAASRGDTLRLTVRASPALQGWMRYSPLLEVRHEDFFFAPMNRDLAVIAGLVVLALTAFVTWRDRRRPVGPAVHQRRGEGR